MMPAPSGSRRSGCRCSGPSTATSPRPTRASRACRRWRWPASSTSPRSSICRTKCSGGQATWSMLGAYLLVHHAAVRLLHPAAVGAARRAGHDRPADQEQRAGRDEGVRHQPVSRGAADARRRDHRRRRAVPARTDDPRTVQSPRRSDPARACAAARRRPSTCCIRRWVVGSSGDIYHFDYYDPRAQQLSGLTIYEFGERMPAARPADVRGAGGLRRRRGAATPTPGAWNSGWTRELTTRGETKTFTPFDADRGRHRAGGVLRHAAARRAVHELLAAARLHGAAARQRLRRQRPARGARAQDLVSRS